MAIRNPNLDEEIIAYDKLQTDEINALNDSSITGDFFSFQTVVSGSGVSSYTNRLAIRVGNTVMLSISGTYSSGAGNKTLGSVRASMIPTVPGGKTMTLTSITDAYGVIPRIFTIDGTGNITGSIGANDRTFILSAIYTTD